MRIVYLSPSGQLGGAEKSLLDILVSLRAAEPGWFLGLIVGAEGPLVSRAIALGVSTRILPYPPALARLGESGVQGPRGQQLSRPDLLRGFLSAGSAVPAYVRQLRQALCDFTPDVLHTNGFKMHILGVWARPRGIPVIWHVRDYVRRRPVMARLLRWHASKCATVVTNSRSVAEDVQVACGHRLKVRPVYNAIDLDRFAPTGSTLDLDALAGLPPAEPGTLRVGLVATLGIWKGHPVFLQALSLLPPSLPVRGYVVGGPLYQTDGSQYAVDELRRLAVQLGISHKVGFTGFVEEPAAAMRALDIVVHASTQPEPFGRVIVEAMACGRALIVSEAGGAAEIITVGTNALGHPPGDAAILAERIRELATDGSLRAKLGKAGRATAERHFDRARLATDLIPIYREVTSNRQDAKDAKRNVALPQHQVRSSLPGLQGLLAIREMSPLAPAPQPAPPTRQNWMHPIRWVPPDASRLLDVGCNVGELLSYCRELYPTMRLAGVEVNGVALDVARQRLPDSDLHTVGAETLPFTDASFDCVTCIEVLEHLPAERRAQALAEMRRVLRPGGRLVLRVPHAGLFACLDPNNLRFRMPALYQALLGKGGRDAGDVPQSTEVVWHHHFTRDELLVMAGDGWEIEACRTGGLLLCVLLGAASWPFYRLQWTDNALFRAMSRLQNFDLGWDYGAASYDLLLVLRRA